MTKLTVALALVLTMGTVAAPAPGQTLSQRVAAIQEKRAEKEKASKVRILQALLYTQLTVRFDRTPARDVFDYLKIALDINVIARYSDDAIGHGIEPDSRQQDQAVVACFQQFGYFYGLLNLPGIIGIQGALSQA